MKILNLERLKEYVKDYKKENKKIVWVNGCFDLLHPGHLYFLKKAREQGDILIIGMDSDKSIKRLKGLSRPIIPEQQRAETLASLEFVNHVLIIQFCEIKKILQELKPQIYFKSKNHRICDINDYERETIKEYTQEIFISNNLPGFSTTEIIKKLKNPIVRSEELGQVGAIKNDSFNKGIFNRHKLNILPLNLRESKISIRESSVNFENFSSEIKSDSKIEKIAKEMIKAKKNNKQIILAFGAHLIKNGLSLVLRKLVEEGYITHLATNGAGSIHDWEFAFQGKSTEDVRKYVQEGQFGIWDETGKYINLAIIFGALQNKGYGEAICEMIHKDKLNIPEDIPKDILDKIGKYDLRLSQLLTINHPYKNYSVQDAAFVKDIPFTVHPGFGYDIIYTHPLSHGASIGQASEIDFLRFVNSVSNLEGGVYLSIGSAIMSPMIFEKSLSMARNIARQENKKIQDFMIVVNDIQGGGWDWNSELEPDIQNPVYYLRFCKTFHRMGAREMYYIPQDNRDFLLNLYFQIKKLESLCS